MPGFVRYGHILILLADRIRAGIYAVNTSEIWIFADKITTKKGCRISLDRIKENRL